MKLQDKVIELRGKVDQALTPLVNRDYWLLEVPYYSNIGDTLIWQGERDFLGALPYKCRGMHSLESFRFPKIGKDDLILFQGGGNFGDLWTRHHDFKMKVVETYPENEFIFLPQTVFFAHEENMRKCAAFLADKKVTICARDEVSYHLLKANFSNRILLVPDMAFCIRMENWYKPSMGKGEFLLKREDKELQTSAYLAEIEKRDGITISDWVTFRGDTKCERIFNRVRGLARRRPFRVTSLGKWMIDFYGAHIYRPFLVRSGVNQLAPYETIYTTRLHAAILGVLLGKTVVFMDNSYGKNRGFYETWLKDCNSVKMMV